MKTILETKRLDDRVAWLKKKIYLLDDKGYEEGYDLEIIDQGIKGTIADHIARYKKELADIYDDPEFLVEKDWKKSLDSTVAKDLRSAINSDDEIDLHEPIKAVVHNLLKIDPKFVDSSDYLEIDEELSLLGLPEDYEEAQEYKDAVNYLLSLIYDYCDNNDIWIPLEELEEGKKRSKNKRLSITPFIKHDAGDVEAGVQTFNAAMSTGSLTAAMAEAIESKESDVEESFDEALEAGDEKRVKELKKDIQWYEEKEDDQPENKEKYDDKIKDLEQQLQEDTMKITKLNEALTKQQLNSSKRYEKNSLPESIQNDSTTMLSESNSSSDLFQFLRDNTLNKNTSEEIKELLSYFDTNDREEVEDLYDMYEGADSFILKTFGSDVAYWKDSGPSADNYIDFGGGFNAVVYMKDGKTAYGIYGDRQGYWAYGVVDYIDEDEIESINKALDNGYQFVLYEEKGKSKPKLELKDFSTGNLSKIYKALKESLDNVSEIEEKSREAVQPDFAAAVKEIKANDEKRDEANILVKAPKEGEEVLPKDMKLVLDESLFLCEDESEKLEEEAKTIADITELLVETSKNAELKAEVLDLLEKEYLHHDEEHPESFEHDLNDCKYALDTAAADFENKRELDFWKLDTIIRDHIIDAIEEAKDNTEFATSRENSAEDYLHDIKISSGWVTVEKIAFDLDYAGNYHCSVSDILNKAAQLGWKFVDHPEYGLCIVDKGRTIHEDVECKKEALKTIKGMKVLHKKENE